MIIICQQNFTHANSINMRDGTPYTTQDALDDGVKQENIGHGSCDKCYQVLKAKIEARKAAM